ncbi:class I SAM-dependent methyltransferase [Micromonospora olivasterospora]|uniref:Methyltransferase family protein n=1 Tax=Micromonospora olivasterospora TaxID=1880 RepID=A0A562I2B0_MICOL|nr:class I SAM-dependent methyltransferase [Micromonospora olivasterospora]TWH65181.1 methyltransferase family protein [Micromonospora olivasterospora]
MTTTDVGEQNAGYMFDNATDEAPHQLRHLSEILDAGTRRTLVELGVGPGWKVTDIGAGAGTLTAWLSDQVAPGGHVTAVDLDPRHITAGPHVTVRAGDIRRLRLEGSQQAIVARLVLMHIPEREQVLADLVEALAPGGALVVADWDCTWRDMIRRSPSPRATRLLEQFQDALLSFGESRGADMGWAKRAPEAMLRLGLDNVDSRVESRSWRGGTGICLLHRSNSIQRESELLAAGMTPEDLAELRQVLMDPDLMLSGYLMHTTVGRRPTQT